MDAFSTFAAPVRKRLSVSPDKFILPDAKPLISEAKTFSKGLRKPIGNFVVLAFKSIFLVAGS